MKEIKHLSLVVDTQENVVFLPDYVKDDIKLKNHARQLAGLTPIKIVVKRCALCNLLFESVENKTCGCLQKGK